MQVYLVVILFGIYTRLEALLLVRVGLHQAGSHGFLYFVVELFYRLDTFFLAIVLRAPDGQRSTPIARTAEVPVIQVFQPLAKTSRTGAFRLPVDGLVQLYHTFLASGAADEPAIQRIVQYGFVRTPAVRIVVYMLFYLECLAGGFHHHADFNIQRFGSLCDLFVVLAVYSELGVVGILHPLALIVLIEVYVDTCLYEILVQFVNQEELTGEVYHRAGLTLLVYHEQGRYTCSACHKSIVRTKGRGNVYDTRTVFSRHIVTRNYTETFVAGSPATVFGNVYRFHPRDELFVLHTYQIGAFVLTYYLERYQLITRLIIL